LNGAIGYWQISAGKPLNMRLSSAAQIGDVVPNNPHHASNTACALRELLEIKGMHLALLRIQNRGA
jgi:hypothetical protein